MIFIYFFSNIKSFERMEANLELLFIDLTRWSSIWLNDPKFHRYVHLIYASWNLSLDMHKVINWESIGVRANK